MISEGPPEVFFDQEAAVEEEGEEDVMPGIQIGWDILDAPTEDIDLVQNNGFMVDDNIPHAMNPSNEVFSDWETISGI